MKKQRLAPLILAGILLLCSCSDLSSTDSNTSLSSSTDSSSATETSCAPKYDYIHGNNGYYNLAEELRYFKMTEQYSGTCWLYAAAASMSTAYERKTGKELDINIPDLLESIYGDDKQEGIFIQNDVDKADLGGNQQFVTEKLSKDCKDGITLDSSMIIDPTNREAIQKAIRTRGGVVVGIDDWSAKKGVFGNYVTVNYNQAEKYDHAVTLIGWDDHFPKEYYKVPASQDGAWIAYNSNDSGRYYYISYCSSFEQATSHTVSEKYTDVLSYDAGNEMESSVHTGDSTKVANVFQKKGKLAAIGTFNDFDKQDIKIEIMSAELKDVLYTQDATLDYHGYHTIELTTPVEVDNFAVAITYTKGAPVEGETIDTNVGSYKTSIEKGQSFVFVDGRWKDMTDSDIKTVLRTNKGQMTFFSENNESNDYLTDSDIETIRKTDFAPGNCCIRALFLK